MRNHQRSLVLATFVAGCAALAGCVAPVGPVEVTRFHAPAPATLGLGTISIEPAPGQEAGIEFNAYAAAVMRELTRVGYVDAAGARASQQVATLSVERRRFHPGRNNSPVSVGVGGSTGSYGSGLGLGVGFNLSGPPPEQVETEMRVMIRDRSTGQTIWEGRASFAVRADSPLAQTSLGAAKMAEALFKDFPGQSGETILVK